ncbi:MAG: peptidoglycan-binding protein, partial [Desulfofustis sp.]|nr:peptidoglycan-binding protein [Desulfofustis sp.]
HCMNYLITINQPFPHRTPYPFSALTIRFLSTLALWCLLLAPAPSAQAGSGDDQIAAALADLISCGQLELVTMEAQKPLLLQREFCLAAIYQKIGIQPLWVSAAGPGPTAGIIIDRLRRSYLEGLNPDDYDVSLIESLWTTDRPDELARLDTLLTYNLATYIHDISYGQLKLHQADPELFAAAGNTGFDPIQAIQVALSVEDLGAYLDSLPPQHHYYVSLKEALEHYRLLAVDAQWPHIPPGPLIRPGDSDPRLITVAARLAATEPMISADPIPTDHYHAQLVDAIEAFQYRHGLNPDGIIGPQTLAMLNRTPADFAAVIRANLARWRWQDHRISDTYLMVNIAAFRIKAVMNNQVIHDLPVIVGKFQHQTPVFPIRSAISISIRFGM